jgi:hypothetical protein
MAKKETKEAWYKLGIICSRCGKKRARYARGGLCEKCYNVVYEERQLAAGEICQVPGCTRGVRMKGMCMSHYVKLTRNAETHNWKRLRLPSGCSACGWNKAACDYHHVIEKVNGGRDVLSNIVYLCPNCHRLVHHGSLNIDSLPRLSEYKE